jgi:hypothetical protein
MNGVQSLYRSCDIELPALGRNKAKVLEKNKDVPIKKDLQEVLKICDPLEKAILLVGVCVSYLRHIIIQICWHPNVDFSFPFRHNACNL